MTDSLPPQEICDAFRNKPPAVREYTQAHESREDRISRLLNKARINKRSLEEKISNTNYGPDWINKIMNDNTIVVDVSGLTDKQIKTQAYNHLVAGHKIRYKDSSKATDDLLKSKSYFNKFFNGLKDDNYGLLLGDMALLMKRYAIKDVLHEKINFKQYQILQKGIQLAEKAAILYENVSPSEKHEIVKWQTFIYNLLGQMEKYSGNRFKAEEYYRKSLSINPNNEDTKFNLKHINDSIHNAWK